MDVPDDEDDGREGGRGVVCGRREEGKGVVDDERDDRL